MHWQLVEVIFGTFVARLFFVVSVVDSCTFSTFSIYGKCLVTQNAKGDLTPNIVSRINGAKFMPWFNWMKFIHLQCVMCCVFLGPVIWGYMGPYIICVYTELNWNKIGKCTDKPDIFFGHIFPIAIQRIYHIEIASYTMNDQFSDNSFEMQLNRILKSFYPKVIGNRVGTVWIVNNFQFMKYFVWKTIKHHFIGHTIILLLTFDVSVHMPRFIRYLLCI